MTLSITDLKKNDFELFGLALAYDIDAEVLEKNYLALLRACHPDQYSDQPHTIQQAAMQYAARVNLAYKQLASPLSRARYYLSLKGVTLDLQGSIPISPDFLMKQMEWRDKIEESGTLEALDTLAEAIAKVRKNYKKRFAGCASNGLSDHPAVIEILQEWMFFEKLSRQINEKAGML